MMLPETIAQTREEEPAMSAKCESEGNGGAGKGLVDVSPVCEGCVLFKANPQHPPPEEVMPIALSEVLQKWMLSNPVRVRETLPVIKGGNLIGLFVWFDRVGSLPASVPGPFGVTRKILE